MGEQKLTVYSELKDQVKRSNTINIEKQELIIYNISITIRLVLYNTFTDNGELTVKVKQLYKDYPTLFDPILTRIDRYNLTIQDKEAEFEIDVTSSTDDTY